LDIPIASIKFSSKPFVPTQETAITFSTHHIFLQIPSAVGSAPPTQVGSCANAADLSFVVAKMQSETQLRNE